MRILILSDIHANHSALEAVLSAAGPVDAVWCLGDLVGYGPDPNECIERIRELPNRVCLLGNHDAAVLGSIDLMAFNRDARLSIQWARAKISAANLEFLRSLPDKTVAENTTLAHGSPRNPIWEYLLDIYNAGDNFNHFETRACLVGHSHLPVAFVQHAESGFVEWFVPPTDAVIQIEERMILNPGSAGQPRDHSPLAAFAIYDPHAGTWQSQRVEYDVTGVQNRILAAGLPARHAERLAQGW